MSDETMAELVEQLHLHADLSPDATTESADLAKDAATALERLAAENAELREALRPFAEACVHLHPSHPDDGETLDGFKVADFRRAAEALGGGHDR